MVYPEVTDSIPADLRALVTGATGFVGSHIVQALLEKGCQVRVLVRAESRRDNIAGLPCQEVIGDITDPDSLKTACDGCQWVFHAAADYRLWARRPQALYTTNVSGTSNVLAAARAAGVERVIYTSTVGVLGIPPDGTPGNEDTPVSIRDMVGHYKRSKFLAEQKARRYAQETGLDLVTVLPSTPVGERDIKPTPTGQIIVDFLNRRMPAYVDTGLNLIDVRDVAVGHILAAQRGASGARYIFGNANMTLQQVFRELQDISGLPAPRARLPYLIAYGTAMVDTVLLGYLLGREPRAPLEGVRMARKKMWFDASRAVTELGLPQSPVRDALARAVRWFLDNGYCTHQQIVVRK